MLLPLRGLGLPLSAARCPPAEAPFRHGHRREQGEECDEDPGRDRRVVAVVAVSDEVRAEQGCEQTASQITAIASEAHRSRSSTKTDLLTSDEGSCGIEVMSPPLVYLSIARARPHGIGESTDHGFFPLRRRPAPRGRARRSRSRGTGRHVLAGQLIDETGMLGEDAALERVAFLPAHPTDVQRICGLLILGLLQLPAVDELHVGDRYSSSLARVLVLQPGASAARTSGQSSSSAAAARSRTLIRDGSARERQPDEAGVCPRRVGDGEVGAAQFGMYFRCIDIGVRSVGLGWAKDNPRT